MTTKRLQAINTSSARNAVILTITISIIFAGAWSVQDNILADAAKPQKNGAGKDVIALSNGYPSGPHFNLNVHGKKIDWQGACDPGGKSVFIPEFTDQATDPQTIQIFSNKKSSVTNLWAKDPCTEEFDNDPAKVQLPSKDENGEAIKKYFVFARTAAKPNNGNNGQDSNILLTPNPILEACNQDALNDPNNDFGNLDSCFDENGNLVDVIVLGLVTNDGAFKVENQKFVRINDSSPGKGIKKAIDITGMFLWTGAVCPDSLDTDGNKVLEPADFGLTDAEVDAMFGDGSAPLTDAEFLAFLAENAPECVFHQDEWVFNVADLVVESIDIKNDGVKLFKVRFYPESTTTFTPTT